MSPSFKNLPITLVIGLVPLVWACASDAATDAPTGPAPVASVSISPTSLTMKVGDTQTLSASAVDAKGAALPSRGITWSSANEAIAKVDAFGKLTALAPGQTSITATSEGKTASAAVSVLTLPSITIKTNLPKIFVGDTAIITWTSQDATSCTRSGSWTGTSATNAQFAYVPVDGGVKTFSLACTGPGGTATSSTSLIVPLPVFASSYENKQAYPPIQAPAISERTVCAANEASAYGDFLGEGTVSLFISGTVYDGVTPGTMCFWRRTAQGTWENATSEVLPNQAGCVHPRKVLVADFNRDKRPDLYIACHGWDFPPWPGERSILLLSTAAGKFNRIEMPTVAFTHGASAADVNRDGYPDVLFMNSNKREVYFLMNDRGVGTFTRNDKGLPTTYMIKQWSTADFIDIDRDGSVDLFISGADQDPNADGWGGAPPVILWGDANGRFDQRAPLALPRMLDCISPYDAVLYGGRLYLLRQCSANTGYAIQRINMSDLSSTIVAENKTADWWAWIFLLNGKLLLERRMKFLTFEP